MSQSMKHGPSVNVIRFPGTLDALQMTRMKPRLVRLLSRHPKRVVLDLGGTRSVKLAGLGILVDRLMRLNGHSEICFSNVSPRVQRTLVRAGVDGWVLG